MTRLFFSKYQGAGNDFVLLDARAGLSVDLDRALVARLCDRRFGIGGDGLMTLETDPQGSDFYMRYFNCDGLESTMCGNGGRCIARFADDLGIAGAVKNFRAVDSPHRALLNLDGTITLAMIDVERVERVGNDFLLNTGSPHYVTFEKPYDPAVAQTIRRQYDCNVNFVELVSDDRLAVRTFERGVEGETYACGTGVVASTIAFHHMRGFTHGGHYSISVPGGELGVAFSYNDGMYGDVLLTGSAQRVFVGQLEI